MNDSSVSPQTVRRKLIWPSLALLGLLLAAFALRVYRLPAQSLWYDEGVSWYLTRLSLPAVTIWTADDIQPPLYYYLLWFWTRLAGTSEYALRFPSVFFGTLTVPLLWATARRLLGPRAAWPAALFLTLSPLHVYYAQEARMYTMLTFLGLLSSYLLLRFTFGASAGHSARATMGFGPYVDEATTRDRPYAWAYVLVTAAVLYTHYFAFFLLAAHALFVVFLGWLRLRSGRPLRPGIPIVITISIVLLYLPWLPFMLTRYGMDTSYWPGALKLGQVAGKLFIAFSQGETVQETIGGRLALGHLIVLLISVAVLLIRSYRELVKSTAVQDRARPLTGYSSTAARYSLPFNLVFLLLYLLVPVLLVLILTWRAPKFNPRYAMLASPAFILLIAGGFSILVGSWVSAVPALRADASAPHRGSRIRFSATSFISSAVLIYILATSIYSLSNWYAPYRVNQFNKADFRITAQIVRERISPDETVLLSSGHMFPAWAYYYGWQGWHRLPDLEILNVNAVLDLLVGDELDLLLRGKRGVWLVRWQNQVTDPFNVLPLYLGSVGVQDDYGQFWHMELFHYSLPPSARFDPASLITQPVEAEFGYQAQLQGVREVSNTEFILFWRAKTHIEVEYTVFVHLLDADGRTLINADHLPARPTREWQPGQIIPDRVRLTLPSDLAVGTYRIAVGLYDASDPGLARLPLSDGLGDRVVLPFQLEAGDLE